MGIVCDCECDGVDFVDTGVVGLVGELFSGLWELSYEGRPIHDGVGMWA